LPAAAGMLIVMFILLENFRISHMPLDLNPRVHVTPINISIQIDQSTWASSINFSKFKNLYFKIRNSI
jgi:hypothetical protein